MGGYWDFFDLQEDPQELHNAYQEPRYQEIIAELKLEMLRQREDLGDKDEGNSEILEIMAQHWDD